MGSVLRIGDLSVLPWELDVLTSLATLIYYTFISKLVLHVL